MHWLCSAMGMRKSVCVLRWLNFPSSLLELASGCAWCTFGVVVVIVKWIVCPSSDPCGYWGVNNLSIKKSNAISRVESIYVCCCGSITYRQYVRGLLALHSIVAFWFSPAVIFLGYVSTNCPFTNKRSENFIRKNKKKRKKLIWIYANHLK